MPTDSTLPPSPAAANCRRRKVVDQTNALGAVNIPVLDEVQERMYRDWKYRCVPMRVIGKTYGGGKRIPIAGVEWIIRRQAIEAELRARERSLAERKAA